MKWRIGISSGACFDRGILDILPAIRASGALGVEVGTPPGHFDPMHADGIHSVKETLIGLGLQAVSIHAAFGPGVDFADPNPLHRHAALEAALQAAGAIKRLGGALVVVHPSDLPRHEHDPWPRLADCAGSLAPLAEACRQEGVTLVLESPLPHLIGGRPDELAWLLSRLDGSARVCLDTGHAFLGGHWNQLIEAVDGRLVHVHANDNRGQWDDHLPPGDGLIDWRGISQTLSAIDFSGWVMLEVRCPPDDLVGYFRAALERTVRLMS